MTVVIIGLCSALYATQLAFDLQLHHVTLCPRAVVYLHEYYRIITSALFHGSFMHVGMNMMSTAAISAQLEKRLGTLNLLLTIMVSLLLTPMLHIVFALVSSLLGYDQLLFQHSIGFSGVIFHLSVLECNLDQGSRSLFGFVSVPSFLYPWFL
jgi:membrane associated rhomboid family serine protease